MRSLIIPAILFLYSCSTPKGLDPTRLPAQIDMELEREIQVDLNGDQIEDTVKLLPATAGAAHHVLEISLSQKNSFTKFESKNLVSATANPGASLEVLENGSFKIIIDHSSAGPTASLREYTVSYNDDKFVVSGITISEYHRVDPEIGGSCDINLITGQGERNSRVVKIKGASRDIASVTSDWRPKECNF